ncbi:hypothetical protein ZEAMMB73_Zm00001d044133 [Zea mays]|uniref:Uncharacterized protein n=1 Tax=Zea mays TaxID=4577 RepID=B4FEG7_MAIZE|nr:unknown [Zea mays]ONM40010.1 hypothetical protein ZEAMMB73_Zm00001d044133 [Zea mays]ONM40011.1 hypothetical protein ZEAMMB73_Zm00001d044133 [Zea mays]ONM40012.1 hypothetical protein ZEAMMB73_Zm00001d044133 [Zea mays]ONM40022.1 hypothetical protein ZEAMMB73_Zm00001d044133 [Zea mays]
MPGTRPRPLGAPLHHQRGCGQRLRLHDADAHRLRRAGLHAGGTLRRRQGLQVAAPGGVDQPGGLLCHRLAARHPFRIHARLPNQGAVDGADMQPPLPELRPLFYHPVNQLAGVRPDHVQQGQRFCVLGI